MWLLELFFFGCDPSDTFSKRVQHKLELRVFCCSFEEHKRNLVMRNLVRILHGELECAAVESANKGFILYFPN